MDPEQLKRVRKLLPNTKVTVGYGSSECAAVSAFDLKEVKAYDEKILASGKIVADVQVKVRIDLIKIALNTKNYYSFLLKIVDVESRALLPPNQTGEILVKSPYIMKGYHEKCSAFIKSPFDKEGYLKTGDLGYYDLDEYLFVTDRINDTFKYQTYQVSPLAIERVLLTHPAVKDCVAFNIFHERDRNHSAAIVTLKKGFQATSEEIKEYANERLSEKNKIRAALWVLEQIPHKTRTGKVRRARIREEFSKKINC